MTLPSVCKPVVLLAIACLSIVAQAQPSKEEGNEHKPYKILTSGRQITIKSSKDIKSVMVWTSSGHRIVEQKEVNSSSFSFTINVSEKIFFLRIQYEGSKPFTEKIGISAE